MHYADDILGFGLDHLKGDSVTYCPAELLSLTAFKEGIDKSCNKYSFRFFIPIYLDRFDSSIVNETCKGFIKEL
jgi:hypothetical protein